MKKGLEKPEGKIIKFRADDLVRDLGIKPMIWEGTKVLFGLSDDMMLSEAELRAYIEQFLKQPAKR